MVSPGGNNRLRQYVVRATRALSTCYLRIGSYARKSLTIDKFTYCLLSRTPFSEIVRGA